MTDREYPSRPIVGIGIVVIKGDSVLLCRRGKPPNIGSWTLPGGAQEVGETCEAAARRELAEETGLTVGDLHFCAYVDTMRRDDDGRVRFHYTILDFAVTYGVEALLMGVSREGTLLRVLRGDILGAVADNLPEEIPLLIHA